jgi:F0F1-type ATP synthase alpha subunit
MCQMLRDMISISEETNWNVRSSVQCIYRSIGAYITHVKSESETFKEVKRLVFSKVVASSSQSEYNENDLSLLNVYEVRRLDESSNFNRQDFFS